LRLLKSVYLITVEQSIGSSWGPSSSRCYNTNVTAVLSPPIQTSPALQMHGSNIFRVFNISVYIGVQLQLSTLDESLTPTVFQKRKYLQRPHGLQATSPKFYPEIHFRSVEETLLM
jgi:hypothetical protein